MRAFAWLFGLILAALAIAAILAWPAWALLYPHLPDLRFHRVASRLAMLLLFVGFVLAARRLGLADRVSLGYGAPRTVFVRELLVGLALGVVLMLPIVAAMGGLELRTWKDGAAPGAAAFAGLALVGIVRGLAVAFIEETFLRGAMYTGIARESGPTAAIVLTSLVYAALHFLASHRIAAEDVTAWSGFELLAGSLRAFAAPLSIADAYLSLFAVGVLLGVVRMLTGNIAACIGLHAGWVWIITFVRETSVPDEMSPWRFLLSRFDGFVGWLVLAWTVLIGLVLVRWYAKKPGAHGPQP